MAPLSYDQKMLAVNVSIFAVIAVLAVVVLTDRRVLPEPPDIAAATEVVANYRPVIEQSASGDQPDKYPNYGRAPVFDTIIPRPTPPPTPVPPAAKDPDLKKAIAGWKVNVIFGTTAMMSDKNSRAEWTMDLKKKDEKTRTVKYQGKEMVVKLVAIDKVNFTITLSYEGKNGKQKVKKGMFDDDGGGK